MSDSACTNWVTLGGLLAGDTWGSSANRGELEKMTNKTNITLRVGFMTVS